MLSYRHQFHAGCAADVFKHAMLSRLVLALARKEKPFFVLDSHAGVGRYELDHPWAEKTGEWRRGVARIWERPGAPDLLRPYLDLLRRENPDGRLRRYPGSPWIARGLMRPDDRLTLAELNKEDCDRLSRQFRGVAQTAVHNMDGFHAVKAFLPPKERRGLLFVDAAFDQAEEFDRLIQAVRDARRRFPTGVVALWHPLMAPADMDAFDRALQGLGVPGVLKLALSTRPAEWTADMRGSGLVVVNPPYGLDMEAGPILDWLWRALAPDGAGGVVNAWLTPPD